MPATSSRIQPHAPVADRVLIPGDPGACAALVVADLAVLGAQRIVRVGTAVAQDLPPGEIVVAASVLGHDGTSRALGGGEPDPALTTALADAGARRAALVSVDVLGNPAAQLALAALG